MIDLGKVLELKGAEAVVEFPVSSACAKCGACIQAGRGIMVMTCENSLGARIGDRVEVETSPQYVVAFSFLLFILPLLFLMSGYFIGFYFSKKEGIGILSSILFFVLAWFLLKAYDSYFKGSRKFTSKILQIIS